MVENPPRAKSLVMTLFGDAITPHGGEVWLGSLIELLAPFGINDRLVRTSVFRLAEEGWLDARREGRRSRYALNAVSAPRFEQAYQRVYLPSYQEWDKNWTLVLAISGMISTSQRANLRKELTWQGFGMIAPGIFAHPSPDRGAVEEIFTRIGVASAVFVCEAVESQLPSARPLSELISQCWALDAVIAEYERLINHFAVLPKILANGTPLEPEHAFVVRTLLIHEFRRVHLHDPLLPLELLPQNWPGKMAYELCHDIYQATFAKAEEFIVETLRKEDESASEAAPYFFHRFGGLV